MTDPPFPTNGFLISGIGAPNNLSDWRMDRMFPTSDICALRARHPKIMHFDASIFADAHSNQALLDIWREFEHHRLDLIADLVARRQPDVLWVHCHAGDYFGHREPPDSPVLHEAFRLVDDTIGRLRDLASPAANILVVSDHGQAPIDRFLLLQNVLQQNGWLHFHNRFPRRRFGQIVNLLLDQSGVPQDALASIVNGFGKSFYELPELARSSLTGLILQLIPNANCDHSNIDWSRTRVYSVEPGGFLRINLRGREAEGTVEPSDYDALVDAVITAFSRLSGRTPNLPLAVHRGSDLYGESARKGDAPDLVVESLDPSVLCTNTHALHMGSAAEVTAIDTQCLSRRFRFLDQDFSGDHSREGLYVIAGPHVQGTGPGPVLNAEDIAPIVLRHMNVDIPPYMDGNGQTEIIRPIDSAYSA